MLNTLTADFGISFYQSYLHILPWLILTLSSLAATYASGVLKNLQMDKPAEYRRQLDMEIHSALYRDDSAGWAQDGLGEMQSMPGDEPFNDIYQSR